MENIKLSIVILSGYIVKKFGDPEEKSISQFQKNFEEDLQSSKLSLG